MCKHGMVKQVELNKPRETSGCVLVPVDSCIADEVQQLNDAGIITLGCCCGHGVSGQYPHVLIEEGSALLATRLGYEATPYYHGPGDYRGVYEVALQ